jgi:hypothetical protein
LLNFFFGEPKFNMEGFRSKHVGAVELLDGSLGLFNFLKENVSVLIELDFLATDVSLALF